MWFAGAARRRPMAGRPAALQLGFDHLPGTTVHRYCSSSVQTSRMAFHAIRAGEGLFRRLLYQTRSRP